jgi:hypothetical protein
MVLAIRIGLALTLAAVAVAAVALPRMAGSEARELRGATEQGKAVRVVLDERGRVDRVAVQIDARCGNGRTIAADWVAPSARTTERGSETWPDGTRVRTTARAEVAADGRSGRVGYSAHLHRTSGENVICRSGPVSFSAR